jgi:Fe-S-cluster containining protein
VPIRRPSSNRGDRPSPRRRRSSDLAGADPWALDVLCDELDRRLQSHAESHPGASPSSWFYDVIDQWVADRDDLWCGQRASQGLPVVLEPACRPGCDHCCYQHVALTPIEAIILADRLQSSLPSPERDELRARLDLDLEAIRRIEAEASTADAARIALARLRRPCPLLDLDSGRCRAYEARPINCRRENSVDPEVCRRYRHDPEETASSLRLVRFDLLWGAAQIVCARWGSDRLPGDRDEDPGTEPLASGLARHIA